MNNIYPALALVPLFLAAKSDFRKRIIPDGCCAAAAVLAALNAFSGGIKSSECVLSAAAVFLIFAAVSFSAKNKNAIGGGDIKLASCVASLLGFESVAVILAALIFLVVFCRAKKLKSYAFAVFVFPSYTIFLIAKIIKEMI